MFGAIYQMFTGRDGRWPALRRKHLKREPKCTVCGTDIELDVHHIDPVSWKPERELDEDNLMTLCRVHHYLFGHLNDWESFNPWVEMDVEIWRQKMEDRPRKEKTWDLLR